MLDYKGFDVWSKEYDICVQKSSNEYPFDGYYDVLDFVYKLIQKKNSCKIMDIGIGTGLLAHQLYRDGAYIYGIDFSQSMIQIAQEKMPKAILKKWDFGFDLPSEILSGKYDYIISSYAIHHLDDNKKIELISELKNLLNEDSKIIIADISFETEDVLTKCKNSNIAKWDNDEIYIVATEITRELKRRGINLSYTQISSCAGVLEVLS